MDYTALGRKDFKLDQAIHAVRETYNFLNSPDSKKSLIDLMEEHRVCSDLLKMLNQALEIMIQRKRDVLLQDNTYMNRVFSRKKFTPSAVEKIKLHEYESNKKLIEALRADLERISSTQDMVDNPG